MEVLKLIDILGITAFAISGALAAMERKLDIFGIFIIAFITAMGGGTLRDLLINVPVSWMFRPEYGAIIFFSALVTIFFVRSIRNFQKTLLLFDTMGLGFFTILGLQKGLVMGLHPGICIALGTISACFGGVIRDILLNTIPVLFHKKEIYATACIIGGLLYFLLRKLGLPSSIVDATSILSIVVIRLVSIRNNWSLPSIYDEKGKEKDKE